MIHRNPKTRNKLYENQNGLCYYCNKLMSLTARKKTGQPARNFATFEHVKRKKDGGKFNKENIVLVHRICNFRKNVSDQAEMKLSQ